MLKEGIIWKNIHPWKFPINCNLNIFQFGTNCKKFDATNLAERSNSRGIHFPRFQNIPKQSHMGSRK